MTGCHRIRTLRSCAPAGGSRPTRVPVWFMRQAGRSLPEYRAHPGRGQHPRRHPGPGPGHRDHAPAGPPLRRRRRHPLLRHRRAGRRHRLRRRRRRPGIGPVVERAVPLAPPTSTACGPSSPRSTRPTCSRPCATSWTSSATRRSSASPARPFTVASYLIEGGPSRTYARTKALMHGDPELWRDAARPPGRPGHRVAALARSRRAPRAIQLFDSWAGALSPPRLRAVRAARQRQGLRRRRPTSACPASTSASAPASCSPLMRDAGADVVGVDWRVAARRGPAPGRARHGRCRATSTRPCASARRGRSSPTRSATCCAATAADPGHVFNLGHGVLPEHRPRRAGPGRRAGPREGRDDGGEPLGRGRDGLRHARRRPTTSRRTTPHIRRGRPPTAEQLADLAAPLRRHRRHLAAGRAHRGAAGRARRPPSTSGRRAGARSCSARSTPPPFIEDAVADAGRRRASRTIVGLVLAPHYSGASAWASTSARLAAAAASAGRATRRPIESWHLRARRTSTSWPAPSREARPTLPERTQGAVHRPLASPSGCWSATRTPTSCAPAPPRSPRRVGLDRVGRLVHRLAERRAHARAVARPRRPRGHPRARRPPAGPTACCVCPQGFVTDHLEVLYDLDIEAPRRGRRGRAWPSPAPASLNDDPVVLGALADRVLRPLPA